MFRHLQSPHDVPARVDGGPAGLSRMPSLQVGKWDQEAYLQIWHPEEKVRDVREDGGSVVLCTGERQHVMRRLDEGRFEYDVVLPEIPAKPMITLPLEFPQGLSFYKQRPTGRDDLVSGSYAVYWRGRNNHYRTGKLCHIYRPKIVDANRRWIWGELDFDGKNLVISMDESWLKGARYPVTVDPIIGTSSVGAKHLDESEPDPEDWYDLMYEMVMPLNRYTAPTGMLGSCNAYVYSYKPDSEAQGFPVLYAESGSSPAGKLSSSESLMDMRCPAGNSEWITGNFQIDTPIAAGTPLWFGVMPYYFLFPYYDDGGQVMEMDTSSLSSPPGTFSGGWTGVSRILSLYFDYSEHTAYELSLGGGVGVGDSMGNLLGHRRTPADSVSVSDDTERHCSWTRAQEDDGGVGDRMVRSIGRFLRLADAPAVWDWTKGRRMLGLVVRKLVSRITRVLNLESRIGDREE